MGTKFSLNVAWTALGDSHDVAPRSEISKKMEGRPIRYGENYGRIFVDLEGFNSPIMEIEAACCCCPIPSRPALVW
jgi:hypothetical protein